MGPRLNKRNYTFIQVLIIILLTTLPSCNRGIRNINSITDEESTIALSFANDKIGSNYEWGANGPDVFDCSGLIVWCYQQSLNAKNIFYNGSEIVSDANMQTIFDYNVSHLSDITEVKPGDIIFITYENGIITHGGLVISIEGAQVTFINASSFFGEVVSDTWSLNDIIRDQWVVGFGRIFISY